MSMAKRNGVDAVAVSGVYANHCDIEVRMSQVEKLVFRHQKEIGITVFAGTSVASASTTDFTKASLQEIADKACLLVKYTEPDPCQGLAEKHLLAWDYPDLDLYHPWHVEPQTMMDVLIKAEAVGLQYDKRIINSEGISFSSGETLTGYANSEGFLGIYPSTDHSFSCSFVAEENHEMQRDYDYTVSRQEEHLMPLDRLAKSAVELTVKRLSARSVKTQQAPVIFAARLARGLLGNLLAGISGKNLYMSSSFLLDKLNQVICPDWFFMKEAPFLLQGLNSVPFDGDGVKPVPKMLVEAGVLKSYLLSIYAARRLGLAPTGNAGGAHNVLVQDTGISFEALVKKMHTGFIVTELLGHGVDIVTGNYSRGASGFWVENGEIAYPVHGVTIASNLTNMLSGMQAISTDIDRRGNIQTGSILINNMTIAGE